MKRTILFIVALAMLAGAVAIHSSPSAPESDLASLAKYRQWTLVNPTPQLMAPPSIVSCSIMPGRYEPSPHLNKYVSVFVNQVGREEMMTKQSPKFPIGSMIVKEKLGSADSTTAEMLTAMIKREPGYNPPGGDWEYLVLDGAATKIIEQGKLTRCSGCHRPFQGSDYITRTYLPQPVLSNLKP